MKQLKKEIIVLLVKTVTYITLYITFVGIFAIENPALSLMSRTLAVTSAIFILMFLISYSIYGGLNIGKQKSRPIIVNMTLGVFITTSITYIFLMIMNTNPRNNIRFALDDLNLLFITLFLQFATIYIAAHIGNYLYFKNTEPSKVIIINNNSNIFKSVKNHIQSFSKEYQLVDTLNDLNDLKTSSLNDKDIIVCLDAPESTIHDLTYYAFERNKKILYNAKIYDVLIPTKYEIFDDILMVSSDFNSISIGQMALKRIIDLIVGFIGVVISLPFILIVGIAIKLEDGGPIFFKQERITRYNTMFDVYKLRSMKVNASIAEAKKDDDRITKVGKVIRKLRIDELPQFINVLKGDMSLVGPRPDNLYIKSQIIDDMPQYDYRVKVKGGLTGYAQIYGKYNTNPSQKLIFDLEYINNYSVWKDIQLIFQTLTVFFKKDSTEGFD